MALRWTHPLTEMSTRNISWRGKGGRCVGLITLPILYAEYLKMRAPNFWHPQGLSTPVMGLLYIWESQVNPLHTC